VEDIREAIEACRRCSLGELRTRAVPGQLGVDAGRPLMAIMCEAPGAQEDEVGRPLVGRAGQLLDKLLAEVGLHRDELLLLNRVRCRPPNNQLKNHPDAVEQCDYWTKEELAYYDPAVVVLMGATALSAVFGAQAKVGETRGTVRHTGDDFEYGARLWVPTYHPASLLAGRSPANRPLVVADLALARALCASLH
jgi:uracil-DNA glycosylase family 4